ncbi:MULTISPECIES: stationary phase inducible protein CsiE [Enterobacteriaceae]|uniref:Stationary phase inducible protein CsiE n=2 Tax=Enterobacteriaceae TaxID=543 RepID=A0ABW1PYI4_9ENTR|nr:MULTISPECIES: stationary phase inducible protein CsiE [Phytobacter]AUU92326.1 PRD domain-containing protein [Enterobacteriaceae bacterium ENNIH3]AUV07630.1 PRD domain-containing protein [Enterobacteriaceae bacterium ENNIH2]MDU4150271.1 stationary phase inducible protein CsiE [Enterobacteriaceae bacterium]PTA95958.1 stationary phase inducible protein CsiE [Kluyvera sp. Nf5]PWF54144.1 stationary phase inducible protein CsiE [[Kluyvera] intestini]
MTIEMTPPSVLSSPQRRCQVLLMLALPGHTVTTEIIRAMNGVDEEVTRQDIAETDHEIQRFHRLTITSRQDGSYRIEGTALDQRLCLLQWLRRGLRLCPHFITQQYAPALKAALKQQGVARTLYDDTNLRALINLCARRLERSFECRDIQFLRLYLQYCLLQSHYGFTPEFNPVQQAWTQMRAEYAAAHEIVRHWRRRVTALPPGNEHAFLSLLFMMLRTPDPLNDSQQQDKRLQQAITHMIARFRALAGLRFSDEQGLAAQLYVHLAQALDRNLFGIGIDDSLQEEIFRLYPRLVRTAREALLVVEKEYGLRFSDEEAGLVAVIFGAWLMQESDLHEKQVVLLTGHEPEREQEIELQLRELTLLPLNIKYLPLQDFQKQGAPRNVTLIVTPYTTPLPLFSPPLIHADRPLTGHQQAHIREMLEA